MEAVYPSSLGWTSSYRVERAEAYWTVVGGKLIDECNVGVVSRYGIQNGTIISETSPIFNATL